MIDVKKLITGFLILAAAASFSAVIVANVNWQLVPLSTPTPRVTGIADQISPAPSNAFVPQTTSTDISALAPMVAVGVTTTALASDPNNLTNTLANVFLNGLVSANPNGLQQDDNGNPIITQPDVNSIAIEMMNASTTQSIQVPNWDIEVNHEPLHIIENPTAGDMTAYKNSLDYILGKYIGKTNLQSLLNSSSPDPNNLSYVGSQLTSALTDLTAIQTPAQYSALQKDMVAMLVYEKNEIQIAENANDDPLKAVLVIQGETNKYNAAIQALETELTSVSSMNATPSGQVANSFGFLWDVFGIQTAHAQFGGDVFVSGGFVVTASPDIIAQEAEHYVEDILLQILKNVLIALIQQHVLSWIQGSGAPRFLTNWATTFTTSYEQAAINDINSKMQCVYPQFAPQLSQTLSTYYGRGAASGGNSFCANTFQAMLGGGSLQQFYGNFTSGGWSAFAGASLPLGNYYGSSFFIAQAVENVAQSAQQATVAQSVGGQGLNPSLACGDKSDPTNGTHLQCIDKNGIPYHPNSNGTCDPGFFPETVPNGGYCADGSKPSITNPSVTTFAALNSAIDSSAKQIASAQNWEGLLNSILNSLINTLATQAINSATNGILGIVPGNIQGGGTPPPPVPLACTPIFQSASTTVPITIEATGGKNDAQGNRPTYNWSSSDGFMAAGSIFSHVYVAPGGYTVTLSDNTGDTPAICRVTAQ